MNSWIAEKSKWHGNGYNDNRTCSVKNPTHPLNKMSNSICRNTLGFDNSKLYQKYLDLPKNVKKSLLNSIIFKIFRKIDYIIVRSWMSHFNVNKNHVNVIFNKGERLTEKEANSFSEFLSNYREFLKDKVYNFKFNDKQFRKGRFEITFLIRNKGWIEQMSPKKVTESPENMTNSRKDSSESPSEVTKPSGNNDNNKKSPKKVTKSTKTSPKSPEGVTKRKDHLKIRKTIELTENQLKNWNPKEIREFLESVSPEEVTKIKYVSKMTLRLNLEQAEKWDIKLVRKFLDGELPEKTNNKNSEDQLHKLFEENQNLKEILKKMIPSFVEMGIEIDFDTDDQIKLIQNLAKEVLDGA